MEMKVCLSIFFDQRQTRKLENRKCRPQLIAVMTVCKLEMLKQFNTCSSLPHTRRSEGAKLRKANRVSKQLKLKTAKSRDTPARDLQQERIRACLEK